MKARVGANLRRRNIVNVVMVGLTYLAAVIVTLPLILILWHMIKEGSSSITWALFTHMPKPSGEVGGGMANAIAGTLIVVGIATLFGLPLGIGAGLYLAEHPKSRLATTVRFLSDVLNGLPSIVIGIFAWQLMVRPFQEFSAWSAGVALGTMMIPLVTRATEEMIRLVPIALREAALALGYTRWRTSLSIILRTAMPGIVTGALVAIARVAGETAPLLFTALGNNFWSTALNRPISALPLQIYIYATSPSDDWHQQAWGASLILIGLVLIISIAARFATRSRFGAIASD